MSCLEVVYGVTNFNPIFDVIFSFFVDVATKIVCCQFVESVELVCDVLSMNSLFIDVFKLLQGLQETVKYSYFCKITVAPILF